MSKTFFEDNQVRGSIKRPKKEGEFMKRTTKEIIVYVLAAIIMLIRADFWWWGKDFRPLLFNWFSWPEIYQLLIWLAGYALVAYTVYGIWEDEDEKEGGQNVCG